MRWCDSPRREAHKPGLYMSMHKQPNIHYVALQSENIRPSSPSE